MQRSTCYRLILATTLILGAGLVVWRATHRSPGASAPESLAPVDLAPVESLRFSKSVDNSNPNGAVERALEELTRLCAEQAPGDSKFQATHLERLTDKFIRRLRFVLEPTVENWKAAAKMDFEGDLDPIAERVRSQESELQTVWGGAPVDFDHIVLRRLGIGDHDAFRKQIGASMTRSPLRPPYPTRTGDDPVYEIVVPMLMNERDGDGSRRVHVGFAYIWLSGEYKWSFRNLSVYSDRGGILAPPQ